MTLRPSFALLFLVFLSAGCVGDMPFDRGLSLRNILDVPGSEDMVLIDVEHVEGLGQGYYVLSLPGDWKSRRAEEQAYGFPALVPVIVPTWSPVTLDGTRPGAPASVLGGEAVPWQFIRGDLTLEEATDMARERLAEGKDSYWIGAIEESGDPAVWTCELLGARMKGVGAGPEGDLDRDVEWVRVCHLEFTDARTASERRWGRLGIELFTGTALLVIIAIPTAVWILILD